MKRILICAVLLFATQAFAIQDVVSEQRDLPIHQEEMPPMINEQQVPT